LIVICAPFGNVAATLNVRAISFALRQGGQELPEPLGGTLIESALPSDPLGAASPAGVWLTGSNNKNHRLASDLCE